MTRPCEKHEFTFFRNHPLCSFALQRMRVSPPTLREHGEMLKINIFEPFPTEEGRGMTPAGTAGLLRG